MNILLIGYGKMGKIIEKVAEMRSHRIVGKLGRKESERFALGKIAFKPTPEVAIEFSGPASAFGNVSACFRAGIPVVSGTTGWEQQRKEADAVCKQTSGAFFYASNFSLGANLFFMLNTHLAKLMGSYGTEYALSIEEIHHTEKKDAPSGTAISLAEDIIAHHGKFLNWQQSEPAKGSGAVPIHSVREAGVAGTHTVKYTSTIDELVLTHIAHNREGFALGAVVAAEWLRHKKGVFGMSDLLSESAL